MDNVTTVIVVTVLVLLGLGIVINGLIRLKKYLAKPPNVSNPVEPDDPDD